MRQCVSSHTSTKQSTINVIKMTKPLNDPDQDKEVVRLRKKRQDLEAKRQAVADSLPTLEQHVAQQHQAVIEEGARIHLGEGSQAKVKKAEKVLQDAKDKLAAGRNALSALDLSCAMLKSAEDEARTRALRAVRSRIKRDVAKSAKKVWKAARELSDAQGELFAIRREAGSRAELARIFPHRTPSNWDYILAGSPRPDNGATVTSASMPMANYLKLLTGCDENGTINWRDEK